jgi:hypothetical protein
MSECGEMPVLVPYAESPLPDVWSRTTKTMYCTRCRHVLIDGFLALISGCSRTSRDPRMFLFVYLHWATDAPNRECIDTGET